MTTKNLLFLIIYPVMIIIFLLISFSCTPDYSTEPEENDTTSVALDTIKYIDLWTMQEDTLIALDTTSTFLLYADCRNDTGIVLDSTRVRFYSNIGSITAESFTSDGEAFALFSPFNSSGDLEAGNLTIIASSTFEEFVSDTMTFYVFDSTGNNPPELTTQISDLTVTEDFELQTITLSNYFTDPDGDNLTYSIETNDTTEILCSINGSILKINSLLNWTGSSNVKIRATESSETTNKSKNSFLSRSYVEASFKVIVSPVNDIPFIMTSLPDTTFVEDFTSSALYLDLYFSDPDGDLLTYSISSSSTSEVLASISGSVLILNPVENWNGISSVTVKAQDSESKLYIEDTFLITVTAVNDAPYVSDDISDIYLDEDFTPTIIDLDLHFSDVDLENTLTYNITSFDSSQINCQLDGSSFLITSVLNWNGDSEVSINCSDGSLSVETSFEVIVNSINDAPIVETQIADTILTMNFDPVIINLNNYFSDPDGETLLYSYELENDTTFNVQLLDNIIVLTSQDSIIGSSQVIITADDQNSSNKDIITDTFSVTVIETSE